jgi:hypothetical protein
MMPERLRIFNPLTLQLSWSFHRWQLVDDGEVLKDFGPREQEARQALRLIRDLGLNQYGTVGSPQPVMEYWLIDGRAPQGMVRGGLRALPLVPATLRVEQVQGQWCVRDSMRVLFTFGSRANDAQQALAVMRKHAFNQVGALGLGAPSMYVFFGAGNPKELTLSSTPTQTLTPGHLAPARFSRVAKNADGTPHVQKGPAPAGSLEGVVSGVLPPLAQPAGGQKTLWREQPHFGPHPGPGQAAYGDRMPFDWRQAQLRVDGGEWKLMVGKVVLARFGSNAVLARQALSALRYYRFTEQWRASGEAGADGEAGGAFYLANLQAPRGMMFGLQAAELDPQKVEVKQADGGYAVVAGKQVLMRFGSNKEEAHKLAETIRHDKLDRVCKLGDPGKEAMTLLVRSH